jgi:hypothetical protein
MALVDEKLVHSAGHSCIALLVETPSRFGAWRNRNSKSQITNIKQITMTKIVRASLGLPTLRAGPQFQNSKPLFLVIEYWNLRFVCNLVLGI